jgi:F0F1-type ATP synthase assembly protein I
MMQFWIKLAVSLGVIVTCTRIGARMPTLGGLIATMPLTSLIVLLWLASDHPGDHRLLKEYTQGVLWGIIPTILFFGVVLVVLQRGWQLPAVLGTGFAVWLAGAIVHQYLLR